MTNAQINKANMYRTTDLVLLENQTIWSSLAAFGRGQTSLAGSINVLAALAQAQGTPLKGLAADKERLRLSLISRTGVVCNQAGPYAYETKNESLAARFDYGDGQLKNTRDSMLDDLAQGVHDAAAELLADQPAKLAEYGLTADGLADLQSAITAYSALVGTPRAAIGRRKGFTEAIDQELRRADENLENLLDRLIVQFASKHPQFVTAYKTARKIVDAGGGESATTPDTQPETPAK